MQRTQFSGGNGFEDEEPPAAEDFHDASTEEFSPLPYEQHLPPLPMRPASRLHPMPHELVATSAAAEATDTQSEPTHQRRVPEHSFAFGVKKSYQFLGWLLGVVEAMFALRLVMHLLSASKDNPFIHLLYGLTNPLLAPFNSALGSDQSIVEWDTLLAMLVYFLIFLALRRLLELFISEPEI